MRFIDLYAGIGGFRLGFEREGHECVWSCEIDKYCRQVYRYRWEEPEGEDVREVDPESISDHEILLSGFPCQSFSLAGERKGFEDTRGTLFHEICRILRVRRPPHCLLENVEGLLSTQEREAFRVVLQSLDELGYDAEWQVLNSKDFGVPQNRPRVFITGHLRGEPRPEVLPIAGGEGEASEPSREREGKGGLEPVMVDFGSITPRNLSNCIQSSYKKGIPNAQGRIGVLVHDSYPDFRTYEVSSPSISTPCGGRHLPFVAESALIHSRGLESKDDGTSHLKGAEGGWSKNFILQKSPDFREDETLREFSELSPTLRGRMGDNLPMVVQDCWPDLRFYGGFAPNIPAHATGGWEDMKVAESRKGKFRVHRDDEKKSEIQGYSLFDERTHFMDVVDGHDRRIIEHRGREKIGPKLLSLVPSLRKESHGHQPKVLMDYGFQKSAYSPEGVSPTVREGHGDVVRILDDYNQRFADGIVPAVRPTNAVDAPRNANKVVRIAERFGPKQSGGVYSNDGISPTVNWGKRGPFPHHVVTGVTLANKSRYKQGVDRTPLQKDNLSWALNKSADQGVMTEDVEIRKLTPVECERLQGFPDGWTEWGLTEDDEKVEISDTQRYKMLGNAVTVNVVEFLAERYRKFEEDKL